MRIAINGFGRIGRNFARGVLQDLLAKEKIEIAVINVGPASLDNVAHMFKYDTLMGTYAEDVYLEGDQLVIGSCRVKILTELDPGNLPWKKYDIDWVVECTGRFVMREGASKHVQAGARKVLISAPAKDEDITIICGVNDTLFDPSKHAIVSMGSCSTNALLPMLRILHDTFGIEYSFMTSMHAYTNSQVLLDVEHHDLRRSRAAALNIIPTTTGAMKVLGKVMPELIDRVEGLAIRLPLAKVSLLDLTVLTKKTLTKDAMNSAFAKASQTSMKGIISITQAPLVSSDFNGDPHSVIIDGALTSVCGDTMGKVFGWYDNEWGYSERMKDFLVDLS